MSSNSIKLLINGAESEVVVTAENVIIDDNGTTLAERLTKSGIVDTEVINAILDQKFAGITIEKEGYIYDSTVDIPDDALDPELISYINTLFASLNDLSLTIPDTGWTSLNGKYVLSIDVDELTGDEHPILFFVKGSTTNSNFTIDSIKNHVVDFEISSKVLTLYSDVQLTTGFTLILKGVNVSGGVITSNYNKLIGIYNALVEKISLDDLILVIPITDWASDGNGNYANTVTMNGINATQYPIYGLYNEGSATAAELSAYRSIISLQTLSDGVKVTSTSIPTVPISVVLKSTIISNSVSYGSYEDLANKVSELTSIINQNYALKITDTYTSYLGKAVDGVVPSSYALYAVYTILKSMISDIDMTPYTNFSNNIGGSLMVYKKAGWCRVSGEIIMDKAVAIETQIVSGLPIPYGTSVKEYVNGKTGTNNVLVKVDTNGILTVLYGTASTSYYVELSYPFTS